MKTILQKSFIIMIMLTACSIASAERIKDIVTIQGMRGNHLSGVGLVVGLNGTGDSSVPSRQMLTNLLRRSGLVMNPSDIATGSIAMVWVTAELGPFDRLGSKIDVDISVLQNASSLQGGQLLMTELKGADGQVYAVASGPLFLGGFTAAGAAASATKNHPTAARIPDGAYVEREELGTFVEEIGGKLFTTLRLRNQDFDTANEISKAVNNLYPNSAFVADPGTVRVMIPEQISQIDIPTFIVEISAQQVKVDMPAIVVINEKTGTIVVGEKVAISSVAVAQGSLVVNVKESAMVSQPTANFSDAGESVIVPDTSLEIAEEGGSLIPIAKTVTVAELAKALNSIGASPRDMIAIFNALKAAGALQAELKIM